MKVHRVVSPSIPAAKDFSVYELERVCADPYTGPGSKVQLDCPETPSHLSRDVYGFGTSEKPGASRA